MTNHWIDIKNSDCILIMGSNAAENHPISFKYVIEAQQKGAKLISVDPRFTRTSSKADIYAPMRSGTDIAILGGMIKYIFDNNLYNQEYAAAYTNAPFIVGKDYSFEDGLFAGYNKQTKSYDKSKWAFEMDANGVPKMDRSLKHPRCVFQILKQHYSRYNTALVSKISGTPEADLLEIYKTYSATGARGKAGTIMYAMGWTQHTVGTQNIRAMAIIQLLLGNMGVSGGGVNALRGESNVQGSTDHCLLWHIWPGYLKTPRASNFSLAAYNEKWTPKSNDPLSADWWQNYPKYSISLLKSFFGENATPKNDYGYDWLPKVDDGKNYSWLDLFDEMYRGTFKGFFAWGQNPACSGANANKTRDAMKNLDWMVNVNLFDNETGSFWRGPGMDPAKIKTEVFFLPAAVSVEKEGSITNSGRWSQWRYQGPKPLGKSLPDGQIIMELGNKIKSQYKDGGTFAEPIQNLKWDYLTKGEYDPHAVAKEINGYFLKDVTIKGKVYKKGTLVPSFAFLQADGSTSSANWLYCNSYTEKGNMAARRSTQDASNNIGLYPGFSWCWPVNRRIIYNRASVDLKGQPWDKENWVIKWDGAKWSGGDVPDGGWPPLGSLENPNPKSRYAFIMRKHGHGQIFGPGLADGPLPEHYEPLECPVEKNLMSSVFTNPTAAVYGSKADVYKTCDPRYPFVGTTYRVTEHWQTGVMTRHQPWLLELQPQVFVEMSEELSRLKGIKNGERVLATSARGQLECTAIVTKRLKPLKISGVGGSEVHQVGFPWCYGWEKPENGKEDSANLLTPSTGDPNTRIPETKAFMVNIQKL
jgi:formate dehydrogenase major subunit